MARHRCAACGKFIDPHDDFSKVDVNENILHWDCDIEEIKPPEVEGE